MVVPRRLGGRRRVVVSPEKIGTVKHGERLAADAGLPPVGVLCRQWGRAVLRAARRRVFLGQLPMFLVRRLLAFADGTHQVIGDFLSVGCRLVLDLVEVNPILDVANTTAQLGTELVLSALGMKIL